MMDKLDTNALLETYRGIATSTIGHLTEVGYLADIKALQSCSEPLVGNVLTVTLCSDNTEVINQALIQAKPNDVLCIDAQRLGIKACWGALRTCAAIYEKLAAVIVIGQVTDSVQIQQLNFPVFAQGVTAVTTFKSDKQQGTLGSDICYSFDEQTTIVRSGDIAIMDSDGVFILSPEQANQLSEECERKHNKDETKFKLFLDAYRNNKLDQLLKQRN